MEPTSDEIGNVCPVTAFAAAIAAVIALSGCATSALVPQSIGQVAIQPGGDVSQPSPLSAKQQKALAPIPEDEAIYPQNKNLTAQQAFDRLNQIDSSYQVGQAFAPADAEFVRIYATANPAAFPTATVSTVQTAAYVNLAGYLSFNKSKTQGGVTGHITGSLSLADTGIITHTYATTLNLTTSSNASRTTITAHVASYGLIGSSGIGLTYETNPSATTSSHSYTFERNGTYTSAEVYSTIVDDATVYASNTSFTVQS